MTCRTLNFPCHIKDKAKLGWAAAFPGGVGGGGGLLSDFPLSTLSLLLIEPLFSMMLANSCKGRLWGERWDSRPSSRTGETGQAPSPWTVCVQRAPAPAYWAQSCVLREGQCLGRSARTLDN